jgi:hypothetical protein
LPYLFTDATNNDELSDILLGNSTLFGVNYVVLGREDQITTGKLTTKQLFSFPLAVANDFSGRSVSNAGDVNGDGYDDLIIGVPYALRCYVLFGTGHGFVNMTQGFTILGVNSGDLTGWSVSGAGDVNNDTFADVIIGAPNSGLGGITYVIYGHAGSFQVVDVGNLRSAEGYAILGDALQDCLGVSVSSAGEIFYFSVDFI